MRLLVAVVLAAACSPKAPPQLAATPLAVEGSQTAGVPPAPAGGPWVHELQADHPLVGALFRRDGTQVDEETVIAALRAADWPMLGEKHDNADHHRLQARMITALRPTGVVFEHLDDGDAIGTPTSPEELAASVGWAESGWPDFAIYAPIFGAVLQVGAAVLPGHPTRDQLMGAARQGRESLGEALVGLPLDHPLDDAQRAGLAAEVVQGHCGMADEKMVDMMIGLQVLKDAWMARALTRHGTGTVLVAGNGHTRRDRGVPHYLEGRPVTLAFLEVAAGQLDPKSYDLDEADFVWFTPRVDDVDPCEKYKESLERMKKGGGHGEEG